MVSASRKKNGFCLYSLLYPLSLTTLIYYSSIRPVCKIKINQKCCVSFLYVKSLTLILLTLFFLRYHTGIVTSQKTVITEGNGLNRSPENPYQMLVSGWIHRVTMGVIPLNVWRGIQKTSLDQLKFLWVLLARFSLKVIM